MKRIVLIGDSLAMPNPENGVSYEESYPFLIKNEFQNYDIITRNSRENNTERQLSLPSLNEDLLWFEPSIVILHLGINDCTPRLFKEKEYNFLGKLPPNVKKNIIDKTSANRSFLTKKRKIVYVEKKKFGDNIYQIHQACRQINAQVIAVSIIDSHQEVYDRCHDLEKNIEEYNQILEKRCRQLDIQLIDVGHPKDVLLEDGKHLNARGHKQLSKKLIKAINTL